VSLVAVPHSPAEVATAEAAFFTGEQVSLIKRTIAEGATDDELRLFLYQCKRTGLDPFSKQIYCIQRSEGGRRKMTIQTGIDGYRIIADRTGRYAPGDDTTYSYDDGKVESATAFVKKRTSDGTWHVVSSTAFFSEYAGFTRDGKLTHMWKEKPHVMLGKCAEALALRRAFPAELSGIYTAEEMSKADEQPLVVAQRPMVSVPVAGGASGPTELERQLAASIDAAAAKANPAISPEADKAITLETVLAETPMLEMDEVIGTTMAPMGMADTAPVTATLAGPDSLPLPPSHASDGKAQGPMYFLRGNAGPEADPDPALTAEYTADVDIIDVKTGEVIAKAPGITKAQNARIHVLLRLLGHLLDSSEKNPDTGKYEWVTAGKYRRVLMDEFGKQHTNELTAEEATSMIDRLQKFWAKKSAGTPMEGREPGQEG
jgi:phage recombination protein Bet